MHSPRMQNTQVESAASAALSDPLLKYSVPIFRGFARYVQWYVKRQFHAVLVSKDGSPCVPPGPLIIYSNHPSWWDPLIFVLLGEAFFPGRRGFGPMEANALQRYSIFARVGAFGIDPNTARGGLEFMVQAKRILSVPTSILWLTAEGAFSDVRTRPVSLRPGLGYLARMIPGAIVLPLALEYPFWNESRPVSLCRFGDPIEIHRSSESTAAEWHQRFEHALSQTMTALSTESILRNRDCFQSLSTGASGVGGIYDGWRRLQAWSRGKRFNPSHEQLK